MAAAEIARLCRPSIRASRFFPVGKRGPLPRKNYDGLTALGRFFRGLEAEAVGAQAVINSGAVRAQRLPAAAAGGHAAAVAGFLAAGAFDHGHKKTPPYDSLP